MIAYIGSCKSNYHTITATTAPATTFRTIWRYNNNNHKTVNCHDQKKRDKMTNNSSIYVVAKPHLRGCDGVLPEVTLTGSDVTESGPDLKWRQSRDRKMLWPEPEVFACACATGTFCTTTTMATGSDRRSRDCQWVPLGVRMATRQLRNICPSGAFWPEVTLWNIKVTRRGKK
jgi:hypothetical protein